MPLLLRLCARTRRMMKELEDSFLSKVGIPALRHGTSQAIHTLMSEEALLLAKYLRNERKTWIPRIVYI